MLILLFSLVNFLLIFLINSKIILSIVCKLMMILIIILVSRARLIMMMGEAARLLLAAVCRLNLGLDLRVDFLSALCLKMEPVFILIGDFSWLLLDLEFLFGMSRRRVLGFFHFIVEFL